MFLFNQDYSSKRTKVTPGANKPKYIILHHNAGGNLQPSINRILRQDKQIGYHFLIGDKGEAIKFVSPEKIVRHAGVSERGGDGDIKTGKSINHCSIGLCILGPNAQGGFTQAQAQKTRELVKHLMKAYNIPVENILTHTAITQLDGGAKQKKLPGLNTPSRKKDVARSFRVMQGFEKFSDYQKSFL